MNEPNQPSDDVSQKCGTDSERTKQVRAVGWTVTFSVLFMSGILAGNPQWPLAFGVVGMAIMVAFVCLGILKK